MRNLPLQKPNYSVEDSSLAVPLKVLSQTMGAIYKEI